MKRLWFRTKRYRWGWQPATWEGWLILIVFVVLVVLNFFRIDATSHSASDTLRPFFIETLITVFVLLGICFITGEKPRWRWGGE
jgi:hypothetical protein